jgi:hypothetical protein
MPYISLNLQRKEFFPVPKSPTQIGLIAVKKTRGRKSHILGHEINISLQAYKIIGQYFLYMREIPLHF